MINRGTKQLYKQLEEAKKLIRHCKSIDEKVALANYIGNIYSALICMGEGDVHFDKKSCFGSRINYCKFLKKLDIYSDKMLQNFIENREFHKLFLSDLLPEVEDELITFNQLNFENDDELSEDDFLDIFYQFMASLSLKEMFDRLYKSGKIYSSIIGSDEGNLGFTLFNPVSKNCDVFIKGFKFDLSSMIVLAHEIGHTYDNECFEGNVGEYNSFFYTSFFGETISRLFERLMFRFLLDKGIKTDSVKDKLIDFEVINFDFLLEAYVLSLLDDQIFLEGEHIDYDSDKIYNMVKSYFLPGSDIKGCIERMQNIELNEIFNYIYGDIISLFLADMTEKYGFSKDTLDFFFEKRSKMFSRDFLDKNGITPKTYAKLYQKEAQLIKK